MSYYSQLTLSLALITLLILLPSSTSTTLLITKTCKQISQAEKITDIYTVCVNLLESDRRSGAATTVEELGVIAFELVTKKIVDIKPRISALSKSSKFDAFVRDRLTFCLERYSDASESLGEALEAYKVKDFDTANIRTSAALDSTTDCEDAFKEKPGEKSPLTKVNKDMFEFCVIPLVFTKITTLNLFN